MEAELKLLNRRLRRAVVAFGLILAIGMLGYRFLGEDVSWIDGLYMTFLTVTTIGFHEVVILDDNIPGQIFTMAIAVAGIGILTYGFSNFAALVIESDLSNPLRRRQWENTVKKMHNHFIICGASRVGWQIAEELERTKRPYVIGDLNEEKVELLNEHFKVGKAIHGDCTEEEILEKLGITKAKGLFITTRDDNLNLVIVVTVRQLNPTINIICHCKEPDNTRKLKAVGATKVVSPAHIGGLRMASEMLRPTVTTFLDEMMREIHQDLRIEEVTVGGFFHRKTVEELPIDDLPKTLLLAVKHGDQWVYNPPRDHFLNEGCRIIVMTTPDELKELVRIVKQ